MSKPSHGTSRKRKTTSIPNVCEMGSSRQLSLINFFGQPRIKRIVSPQTPPSKSSNTSLSEDDRVTLVHKYHQEESKKSKPKKNVGPTSRKREQLYLDFGQSSFGKRTQCPHCGTLYVDGVAEDRDTHNRVCREYRDGVALRVTPNLQSSADVMQLDKDTFIVEVKGSKGSAPLHQKVRQVRKIAEQELGFASSDLESLECNRPASVLPYAYFLHVVRHHVVGLLATEKITRAFALQDEDTVVYTETGRPASLGIHLIWVHQNHRGKKIATSLLNVARERSVYGYTSIPHNRIAFSSPTEAGLGFARAYMKKSGAPVLVYQFANPEQPQCREQF